MEKLAHISPSRSQTSSLPKLILNQCSLHISDVKLLIHPSISDDSFECLWEIDELKADSRLVKPQCFLRGYINSLFVYSKDSYFDLEIKALNTTLKSHDHVSQLCSATDIITSLKLNDFQLSELHCSNEELGFSFSPADISTILVIMRELSRKSSPVRNGKQLWKITAMRIRSFISTRRWSMWKVVSVVCLWLRYIHGWENIFAMVGNPMYIMIKRSTLNMSTNPLFSDTFRRQWEIISEIEKELPAPAIALARRVVRCRKVENVVLSNNELQVRKYLGYFPSICQFFCLIGSSICSMFISIIHWVMLRNSFGGDRDMKKSRVLPEDFCPNVCYRLNLEKILITVSPDNTVPYVGKKLVHELDLLSFSLVFDTFIIIYNENICESHLIFSCGSFKVMSSSAAIKEHKKPEVPVSNTMLWGKPAPVFDQKGVANSGTSVYTEMVSLPLLENLLNQMWLDWKISCEFESTMDKNLNCPFILCEIKHLLEDQVHCSLSNRFFKCCLAVGQLDFLLEYPAALSFSLLFQQMQHVFSQREKAHTSNSTIHGDPPMRVLDYHSCIIEMEKLFNKVLPERLNQVGVYIAGPQIRVSLRKDGLNSRVTKLHKTVDGINLSFDCRNIELMMSPNVASSSTLLNDEAMKCMHVNERYKCQGQIVLDAFLKVHGLNAYLDESPELQQSQIISLKPISIQLSTIRYGAVHSWFLIFNFCAKFCYFTYGTRKQFFVYFS